MGGGNAQKTAMARQRKQDADRKKKGGASQLKVNSAALSIVVRSGSGGRGRAGAWWVAPCWGSCTDSGVACLGTRTPAHVRVQGLRRHAMLQCIGIQGAGGLKFSRVPSSRMTRPPPSPLPHLQCQVCRSTFSCTSTVAKLKEHSENKHPKNVRRALACGLGVLPARGGGARPDGRSGEAGTAPPRRRHAVECPVPAVHDPPPVD